MAATRSGLPFYKYVAALSAEQQSTLTRLASLSLISFNESDVREEFLVPLISLLGYERNSDYQVLREDQYDLNPFFLTVGSKRVKLDYRFNVYKAGFWLLEAKGAQTPDGMASLPISSDAIAQAHFYAHHRAVDCPLFGVSNGWHTVLYDRDADDPSQPILTIPQAELPARFGEIYELIGSRQVTFAIKRRLLKRIEQVLSADVDLERADEFIRGTQAAGARARPKVLENFRRNAKLQEEKQSAEFAEYLRSNQLFQLIDTVLTWPLDLGRLSTATSILAERLAQYRGSNQFLFFHKLLVKEPRPVTIDYYVNALALLGGLCSMGELSFDAPSEHGVADTPITGIYAEFAGLLLSHFSSRPDLRVMWAMEGLLKRMSKRALLSNLTARTAIAAGVRFERYLRPEDEIAYLGPSPARTVRQAIESMSLAELGMFFSRHANRGRSGEFDVRSATDEFQIRRQAFEVLENATDAEYNALTASLGQEWSELSWSDRLNRTWDRLGHAVCEILLSRKPLLQHLNEDSRARLRYLARLGNPFARQCAESIDVDAGEIFPDAQARLARIFTLVE